MTFVNRYDKINVIMWPMHDDQVGNCQGYKVNYCSLSLANNLHNAVQHVELTVNFHATVYLGSSNNDCLCLGQKNFTVLNFFYFLYLTAVPCPIGRSI